MKFYPCKGFARPARIIGRTAAIDSFSVTATECIDAEKTRRPLHIYKPQAVVMAIHSKIQKFQLINKRKQ